jgi:arylsulfatase
MNAPILKRCILTRLLKVIALATVTYSAHGFCGAQPLQAKESVTKPNILLIVADDMGYSDIGSFGSEISTPNLDKLAYDGGSKLTNFHVAPTCSPTRSMLMSGTYNHMAGLGAMAEWVADNQRDKPGYEGYLNDRVAPLPALLKDAGYHTFMAGKWHLGMLDGQGPDTHGFDDSFAMLPGAGDHYSDRGLFPFMATTPYRENGKVAELPENFYSTTFYSDKAIQYIDAAIKDKEQPFFGYLAYTAPHWPLQVDPKYSDKYKGKYSGGYEKIKAARLDKLTELGFIDENSTHGASNACYPQWQQLTSEEQSRQAHMMEIYAGMVDALDENIGRVLQHLKDIGEFDNTLIVFISDNGADARPEQGLAQEAAYVQKTFDNSMQNMGKAGSFVSYGGAWAQVSNTPLSLHKGMVTEGGIRVPAIIHLPKNQRQSENQTLTQFASVMDLLPTFVDIAGAELPGSEYKGKKVLPVVGKSILPYLRGEQAFVHKNEMYGFSVHGRQGLQYNQWKLVRLPAPFEQGEWQLFNLDEDLGETHDLAATNPDQLKEMIARWDSFAKDTGVIISDKSLRAPRECINEPEDNLVNQQYN